MKLMVATNNPGKLQEYHELLSGLDLALTSLKQEGIDLEPEETGRTFEENAILKARIFAAQSGLVTIADDSGLEVDALDGAPGVYSARYGGTGRGQDRERYQLLLRQLAGVEWQNRTARFRCVVAISEPDGDTRTACGSVEGMIAYAPQGEHGFGYDPVFFVPEYDCTMAQLESEFKNRISHRAAAVRAAMPLVQDVIYRNRK